MGTKDFVKELDNKLTGNADLKTGNLKNLKKKKRNWFKLEIFFVSQRI